MAAYNGRMLGMSNNLLHSLFKKLHRRPRLDASTSL